MLGWRKVPVDNTHIGETSREVEPDIRQIIHWSRETLRIRKLFERKLYVIRKQAGQAIRASGLG